MQLKVEAKFVMSQSKIDHLCYKNIIITERDLLKIVKEKLKDEIDGEVIVKDIKVENIEL